MQRPSCSSRWIILPSTQTRIAADSATGDVSARMAFIVSVGQLLAMFENKTFDFAKIVSFDSFISREQDIGIEPELTFSIRSSNVYVWWFISFIGVKMKAKRSDAQDGWHGRKISEILGEGDFFSSVIGSAWEPVRDSGRHHSRKNRSYSPLSNRRQSTILAILSRPIHEPRNSLVPPAPRSLIRSPP